MPPLKPWQTIRCRRRRSPLRPGPPLAAGGPRHVRRRHVVAVDVVEEAVPGLADDREAPASLARRARKSTIASRTTPTECVLVSPIGVVSIPESRIHSSPVSSPLPLSRCTPAKSGSGGGTTTVTPVRTPSPSIRVVWPTPTPSTSVIASAGPDGQPADLDPELAGACHVPDDSSPAVHVRCPAHGGDEHARGSRSTGSRPTGNVY